MRFRAIVLAISMIALSGCGGDDATSAQSDNQTSAASTATAAAPSLTLSPTMTPTPTPLQSVSMAPVTVVTTADSEFGQILFDDTGQAIYLFDKEETGEPDCYDDCAEEWPPVLTKGDPVADGKVAPDRLGTTKRTDGGVQVTYGGHPLYYYAHEGQNEVKCHNIR